jgi:hypothetical protein
MRKILLMGAVVLALGAAGVAVQIFFAPLSLAGCPASPP